MTKDLLNERLDFDEMDFLRKLVYENPNYTNRLIDFEAVSSVPVEDEEDEEDEEENEEDEFNDESESSDGGTHTAIQTNTHRQTQTDA